MRSILYLAIVCLLGISAEKVAAQDYLPYSAGQTVDEAQQDIYRNFELTVGYVPNESEGRLKTSLGVNNLLFHRLGGYTSFEYDLNGKKLTNIAGATVSLHRFVYLWGGMDIFTSSGLIQNGYKGVRKEIGIGITPYKFVVARIGWSSSVGLSLAGGVRIPF